MHIHGVLLIRKGYMLLDLITEHTLRT